MEGGFIYGKQQVIGDVIHWLYEMRDSCEARIHTKGTVIIKRTNYLQYADMTHVRTLKRRARESNDPVHHIVDDQTVIKLPKIVSLNASA